jgi:hypothetical protein
MENIDKQHGRVNGRIYFGETDANQWSVIDPECAELTNALWTARCNSEGLSRAQLHLLIAAAEAYVHLTAYPSSGFVMRQLRSIRRALKDANKG